MLTETAATATDTNVAPRISSETAERLTGLVRRRTQKKAPRAKKAPRTSARAGFQALQDAILRGDYIPPATTMTKADRIAHFLYWCSQRYPRMGVPNEWLTQVIEGLPKPATKGSPEMKLVMGKLAYVKKALVEKHGRLVVQKTGTTRMCVDELDEALFIGPKVDKQAFRALSRAHAFHAKQDLSKIPDTAENRLIIEQQQRAATAIDDMIKQAEVALLPPKTP
jgi:hypothetical protein